MKFRSHTHSSVGICPIARCRGKLEPVKGESTGSAPERADALLAAMQQTDDPNVARRLSAELANVGLERTPTRQIRRAAARQTNASPRPEGVAMRCPSCGVTSTFYPAPPRA